MLGSNEPSSMQRLISALSIVAVAAGGCSSSGAPELSSGLPSQVQQAQAPEQGASSALPELPSLTSLTKSAALPVGTPTEVYTRVARGALTCWFGASGPLKGPYIYNADADPPSKGGKAEIFIRTRDREAADPRSLRAFRIGILPSPEGTKVDVENAKIPEPLATRLASDVRRWAADNEGCGEEPVVAGWGAAPAPPDTAKPTKTKAGAKSATPVKN